MNKSDLDAGAPAEDGRFFPKAFSFLFSARPSELMRALCGPNKARFEFLLRLTRSSLFWQLQLSLRVVYPIN